MSTRPIGAAVRQRAARFGIAAAALTLGLTALDFGILAVGIVLLFAVSLYQEKRGSVREMLWGKNPWVRYSLLFILLLAVLLLGKYGTGYNASSFIYNQF